MDEKKEIEAMFFFCVCIGNFSVGGKNGNLEK
jgi:hypothetical protein